jgi:RNA polymerase sigma factor (TIGR02999 family)
MSTDQPAISSLMDAARRGDVHAARTLWDVVYQELRRLAQSQMNNERRDHTLQATALVNEAFARLVNDQNLQWATRGQFFAAAGEAMRRILIEHARARARIKRGGDASGRPAQRLPLDGIDLLAAADDEQIVALDDALQRLEIEEPDVAAVVRLRFFAGLTGDQTAETLGMSARQIDRLWAYARARLYREMGESAS